MFRVKAKRAVLIQEHETLLTDESNWLFQKHDQYKNYKYVKYEYCIICTCTTSDGLNAHDSSTTGFS